MLKSNIPNQVQIIKHNFTNSVGLPFRDLLPESTIRETLEAEKIKYRRRLFDPFVTLWAFLSQVLDVDKSCANVISRVIAWLASKNTKIPSDDTSAYCQARQRLQELLLQRLFSTVAQKLQMKTTIERLWCGRHVKVIDGLTVSMPDTPLNQAAYPQPSTQAPGCGFPIAKIGLMFSLATGAAVALATDVLNSHDIKLARVLYGFLNPGDVVLGDRAFCSYADLVFIQNYQADAVFRKHQGRKDDTKAGKRKGSQDKLVVWEKPQNCPKSLTSKEFASLPQTLTVREVQYYIIIPGFRSKQVTLITTILDSQTYPTLELVRLYSSRWDVELNLKHLKRTLGMEKLRGKTPEMVRKEVYIYLLAYNLLRTLMWEAGTSYGVEPLSLSLQKTRQYLNSFIPELTSASAKKRHQLYQILLEVIVGKPVSKRPGRSEPRVKKRRPKAYLLMRKPRAELRRQLKTA